VTAPARTRRLLTATSGVAVAVGALLVLSACSATNPITSQKPYNASDGVRVVAGDVTADNLLVLTEAQGAPGTVTGAVTNHGTDPGSVTLTFGTDEATFPLQAGETVLLGGASGEVVELASVDVAPGGVLPVVVTSGSAGATQASVPVLDGTLPEYASQVPTAPAED